MKKLMGATRCFFATKKITMYFFVAICLQLLGIQAGILRTGAIASAMEHTPSCWSRVVCTPDCTTFVVQRRKGFKALSFFLLIFLGFKKPNTHI